MMRYRVSLEKPAQKQLRAILDRKLRAMLERSIMALADAPRPQGVKKLAGEKDQWRIRVGDWRVVYRIDDGVLVVMVVTVTPRSGAYR